MKRKVDQYPIFSHWYKTLDWILDTAERLPKSVRFSISQRLMELSLDIIEILIEAIYNKNRNPLLNQVHLKLEKLRVLFRICHDRRYISTKQYAYISKQVNEAGKMCGGWMKNNPQ